MWIFVKKLGEEYYSVWSCFLGEPAVDTGGPKREFFLVREHLYKLLCKYCLFILQILRKIINNLFDLLWRIIKCGYTRCFSVRVYTQIMWYISIGLFQKNSKTGGGGEGGEGVENIGTWKFCIIMWHPLEIPSSKIKTHGNPHKFFFKLQNATSYLIEPWNLHMLFPHYPWKFHVVNPPLLRFLLE